MPPTRMMLLLLWLLATIGRGRLGAPNWTGDGQDRPYRWVALRCAGQLPRGLRIPRGACRLARRSVTETLTEFMA